MSIRFINSDAVRSCRYAACHTSKSMYFGRVSRSNIDLTFVPIWVKLSRTLSPSFAEWFTVS